jgi:hypothetical protein
MNLAYAWIAVCLSVLSGCEPEQQNTPPSIMERYGSIPLGSRIVVRLSKGGSSEMVEERSTPLLRATGWREFEGSLVAITEEGVVMQPVFSRSKVHFGASVIREIEWVRPGGE